jgi:hypothetical protein
MASNAPDGSVWTVFEASNSSSLYPVRFHTAGIDVKVDTTWAEFHPTNEWPGLNIWNQKAGSQLLEIPWPPGLPYNSEWRLRLECAREPSAPKRWMNAMLGREAFHATDLPGIECPIPSGNGQK